MVFVKQYGRLRLVQWLVENTGVRDKVRCKDGERSLLHIAAKYAQEEVSNVSPCCKGAGF